MAGGYSVRPVSGSDVHRPWKGAATEVELEDERRRERRRSWVRPASALVALMVVLVDVVVVFAASAIQTAVRVRTGYTCDTFWRVLAHDTFLGVWIVLALVAVTLLATVWRRWVFLATLVVQIAVAGVLIPNIVHKQSQYLQVAAGTLSPVQVDTGGVACS